MMSLTSVVDQMAADLAERRRTRVRRNSAYLALARVIMSDSPSELPAEFPAAVTESHVAA